MSEAQMDEVTGGGVVDVLIANPLNDWTVKLEVALQANVAANVNAGVALIGSAQALQGMRRPLPVRERSLFPMRWLGRLVHIL